MIAETPRIPTAEYIAMFDEVLASALGSGGPGDWNKLQRRLDALSVRVRTDAVARERGALGWPYRLERGLWIEVLTESLHPEALARLAETLLDETEAVDTSVWAPLDVAESAQEVTRTDRREARAEAAVLAALHQYVAAPRLPRIVEGIRALEELHEARISTDPIWDWRVLEKEARRLGEAITAMFPPRVRLRLRHFVDCLFRSEIEETPVDKLEPARLFWYHQIPGIGFWYPAWSHVLHDGGLREEGGTWFVADTQAAYEAALAVESDTADQTSEMTPSERPPPLADQTSAMVPSDTPPPPADGSDTDEVIPRPGSGPPEPHEDEPEPPPAAVTEGRQQIPAEPSGAAPLGQEIGIYDAAEEAIVMQRAEARLRVWCLGQRMIPTPKHIVSSQRVRLMSRFASEIREEMRTRTDKE
jgi:hypothetical protein